MGLESNKSRFPSLSIDGMNEDTRIMNNVKSINLGIPETIYNSKSNNASANFSCPDIDSRVLTPSTESRFIKYNIRLLIRLEITQKEK